MQNFSYHRPADLAEALALKAREPDARFLAGGTDLFLAMEHGPRPVASVIDLKGIEGLAEIRALPKGGFALGALTLMADIEAHPDLRGDFPALCEAAAVVGGRNARLASVSSPHAPFDGRANDSVELQHSDIIFLFWVQGVLLPAGGVGGSAPDISKIYF